MLFNSPFFLYVFLPIALVGFAVLGRFGRRSAIGWLALISILFYAKSRLDFVAVLLGSMLGNYLVSRLIVFDRGRPGFQRFWLVAGIVANLAVLAYFKYLFPLLHFLTRVGISHQEWGNAILPLGISFFTFTQVGYLIDLKQGEAEPRSLVDYVFFVTFFPRLIAGPFLHDNEIMPQLPGQRRYGPNRSDFAVGLTWFTMGLFKKVMIADMISPFADSVFAYPGNQSIAMAWVGSLTYLLQLYFDFSGYSDMAIGLARMFSIRFPFNFDSPYKAKTVTEYWSRWHMTLTRFVTLYVFTPLSMAMSRSRLARGEKVSPRSSKTLKGFCEMVTYPTMVTMLIVGAWHGAGFQFLIFGLIHGVCMTMERAWRLFHPSKDVSFPPFVRSFAVLRVMLTVLIGDIFFRSSSTGSALMLLRTMTGLRGHVDSVASLAPLELWPLLLFPIVWFLPNTQQILGQTGTDAELSAQRLNLRWTPSPAWAILTGAALFLALVNLTSTSFLYFKF
jgi:D-alanyl-lipoteichoic acid acyltransferase DltB (MBOAT superfamily)